MAQVVTNENMVEFVTTGKVAEFKPPEAPKEEAKTETKEEPKVEAATDDSLQTRNEDGTFKSKAETSAEGDPEDAALPERVRKQIGKKHRQMMEAQEFARERDREAAAEKARADALERELASLKGAKSKGPDSASDDAGDPAEPKPEDFKTVGEYTRALTKYEVAKAATAAKEQGETLTKQQQAQAQAKAITDSFAQRQAAYIKENPEYEEILESSDLDVPHLALQYIVESESGPQLAVHLAKNPSEAERLRKLSPARMIAEMGKMEAKFESKPSLTVVKTPAVSKAPAPTQSLNGDASTVVHKDPKEMSFAELRAFRQAERAQKRV